MVNNLGKESMLSYRELCSLPDARGTAVTKMAAVLAQLSVEKGGQGRAEVGTRCRGASSGSGSQLCQWRNSTPGTDRD